MNQQLESHLTLHFSESSPPRLMRTSFFMPDLFDERCELQKGARLARAGDFRWTSGVQAVSLLILELILNKSDLDSTIETSHRHRTTLFNLLSKAVQMEATGWIKAIFGFDAHGRPYLSSLLRNFGSARNPRPVWDHAKLPPTALHIFWRGKDISESALDLARLFRALDGPASHTAASDMPSVIENPSSGGILGLSDDPQARVRDFKACLLSASGTIFITGSSMISLSEDSGDVLQQKVVEGATLQLLILDPIWADQYADVLTFLPPERRSTFHLEVQNSIAKLRDVHDALPKKARPRIQLKGYRTIFPYIVTGYHAEGAGRCVAEINDHLPERHRPRFLLDGTSPFFSMILGKFRSLWSSDLTRDLLA